jgi:hypothetical protein
VKDEEGGDEEKQLVMSSHHLYPEQLYTKRSFSKLWIKNERMMSFGFPSSPTHID